MPEQKRAVLFANGILSQTDWLFNYIQPNDFLVAVDGGYQHLKKICRNPHLLVGDLDSLKPADLTSLKGAGVEIIKYPAEKDQTDLELALEITRQRGYQTIHVIAAFGGRLDQTLANLLLLAHPRLADCHIRLEDVTQEAFLIRGTGSVQGQPGDTVSIFPLGGQVQGVSTQGLAYPLEQETLFPYLSRGVSNEMTARNASIIINSGLLLCIHLRKDANC
jgi:thiamine pyrophosphokinase